MEKYYLLEGKEVVGEIRVEIDYPEYKFTGQYRSPRNMERTIAGVGRLPREGIESVLEETFSPKDLTVQKRASD